VQFNDVVSQNQFRIGLFGYATEQATAGPDTHQWTTTAFTRKYLAFEVKADSAGGSGTSAISYLHTDHLGGTHVISDESGQQVELNDYYPFGDFRINESSVGEQRKYTGHEYDEDTGLTYMGARYYPGNIGRFISQDPAYLAVGNIGALQNITQLTLQEYLSDPQGFNSPRTTARNGLNSTSGFGWKRNTIAAGNSMSGWAEILADPQAQNSYAYARNNPLKYTDPDGEFYQIPVALGVGALGGVASQYVSDVVNNYQSGVQGWNVLTQVSDGKTYTARAAQGAAIGLSVLTGNPYVVGGTAAGTSVLTDKWLGQETNWTQTGIDAVLSGGTAGVFKLFPKVPGRLPNFGTQAFFTGKHTQQEVTKEAINVFVGGIKDAINAIGSSIKELQKGY